MRARDRIKLTLLELLTTHSADDLAVKMLCLEAKISKQTLYNNFYGIVDAVKEVIGDLVDEAGKDCHSTSQWMDGIKRILIMFRERKEVIMHLYHSKYRDDLIDAIREHVVPIVQEGINEKAEQAGLELPELDQRIITAIYMDIFMGLLTRYMNNRLAHDPEYIVSRYSAILENHTNVALSRIEDLYK